VQNQTDFNLRLGIRGACIEGVLASCSPYIGIMDADLQHDERLCRMLKKLESGIVDLVIASRYVAGDGVGEQSSGRVPSSGIARCRAPSAKPRLPAG
jgi:dolichol-phosphate mannosyltransferase